MCVPTPIGCWHATAPVQTSLACGLSFVRDLDGFKARTAPRAPQTPHSVVLSRTVRWDEIFTTCIGRMMIHSHKNMHPGQFRSFSARESLVVPPKDSESLRHPLSDISRWFYHMQNA